MRIMQENNIDKGAVTINVLNSDNIPIQDATISISYTGNPEEVIDEQKTDENGRVEEQELPAPPVEWSLSESNIEQPYSEYSVQVNAEGYLGENVSGIQILSETNSIQIVKLRKITPQGQGENIVIPAHTLYGQYPEKIPEDEVKPLEENPEIVLSRVVVPEYVVVHDGAPSDSTAKNYYVTYRDYIKNVASSEIYATWPKETLRANILAIMSFTLNRTYTEWYRSKGYDFTITSSTAYDHKWMNGRNIYTSIADIVDEIFDKYLSRPNVKQPILTQYCDGRQVTCDGWMTQWGSKSLGDSGYTDIEILRYYYGYDMYVNTAELISGIPSSWPGYNLDIGASGEKVRTIQEQLNKIATVYSAVPRIVADGRYGEATKNAVLQFQKIFGLPQSGVVDFRTWYKISQIYTGITRIAEFG